MIPMRLSVHRIRMFCYLAVFILNESKKTFSLMNPADKDPIYRRLSLCQQDSNRRSHDIILIYPLRFVFFAVDLLAAATFRFLAAEARGLPPLAVVFPSAAPTYGENTGR